MSHVLRIGVVDQIAYFRAYNTDGSGLTTLTAATDGLSLSVFRVGLAAVSIASLSNKAADNTAHADGAIRHVGGNLYTVDLPDAATASQTPSIGVRGTFTGGVIEPISHPIVNYDPALVAVGAATSQLQEAIFDIVEELDTNLLMARLDDIPTNEEFETRIPGVMRTAAQDGEAEAAQVVQIVEELEGVIVFDPIITVEPTELSAGSVNAIRDGLATEESVDALASTLGGVNLTRISPFDPTSRGFKLIQGDDYIFANDGHIDFDINDETAINLSTATATVVATSGGSTIQSCFEGVATIIGPTSASPKLRIEWPNAGQNAPVANYIWEAKLIDANGNKKTRFRGELKLLPSTNECGT